MIASRLIGLGSGLILLGACTAEVVPDHSGNEILSQDTGADRASGDPSNGDSSRPPDRMDREPDRDASEPAIEHPNGCPIVRSGDWSAWVDAMPGPNSTPTLIVTGSVTVPTGGYRLSLELGPIQEISPPFQMVYLRAIPPSGPATQALETKKVRGEFAGRERYGGVSIVCGGRLLADIQPVRTAH